MPAPAQLSKSAQAPAAWPKPPQALPSLTLPAPCVRGLPQTPPSLSTPSSPEHTHLPRPCSRVDVPGHHLSLQARPCRVPGVPHIPGKEQMGPRSLLLGPGVHPEEGSISACCPHGRGWGWGAAHPRLSWGGAAQMLLMGWGRHVAPRGPTGSRAGGPGGRREGKRRPPGGPPPPRERAGPGRG